LFSVRFLLNLHFFASPFLDHEAFYASCFARTGHPPHKMDCNLIPRVGLHYENILNPFPQLQQLWPSMHSMPIVLVSLNIAFI